MQRRPPLAAARRRAARLAFGVALALGVVAALGGAEARAQGAPVTIYGIELESRVDGDRLLVFADRPVSYEAASPDPRTLQLDIAGAVLDRSAPRRLTPEVGAGVTRVTAMERAREGRPLVRIAVEWAGGAPPEVTQRGAILALHFERPESNVAGMTLQYRSAELADVVRDLGRETGRRFVFDERLQGRVTITVSQRVSPAEAFELLNAALLLAGFGAVPTPSGALKIVKIENAPASALWRPEGIGGNTDAPIVTLLHLQDAAAERVAAELAPLSGNPTLVMAHEPTNALVLAGSEARLRRLIGLARALDVAAQEEIVLRRLRHRSTEVVVPVLEELYRDRPLLGGRFQVWPDERTQTLTLRAPAGLVPELRERLDTLDRPIVGGGGIEVIPVRYTDGEALAALLSQLSSGETRSPEARGAVLRGRSFAIAFDPPTHSLVVSGDAETLALVKEVVDQLDRQPPRVDVELLFLEIDTGGDLLLGFDFFLPLTDPNSADDVFADVLSNPSGGGLLQPGTGATDIPSGVARIQREPLVIPIVDENGDPTSLVLPQETFVITADEGEIYTRVKIRPHLLVTSGEEQELFVGDNIPIPVARTDAAAPLTVQQSVQRQDVGTSVRVRPTVGQEGGVQLDIRLETTRLAPSLAGDVEVVGPTIAERLVETTARLSDGQWLVIGMGHDPITQETEVGTPWLKDIPILGALNRTTRFEQRERHTVVAVNAKILRSNEEQQAETIRRRLGFERSLARGEEALGDADGPVALLLDSFASEAEAEALVESLGVSNRPARVSRWEYEGRERFDVYVTGFRSLTEAGAAAMPYVAEGWSPQIVVTPGSHPDPASLHLGSRARVPPTSPF